MTVRLVRGLLFLMSLLPLAGARALGAAIGLTAWYMNSRGANTARTNLTACFPDKNQSEVRRLARESMKHWGMTLCEIPVVWRAGRDAMKWVKSITGEDLVAEISSDANGVILICPHLGNWELMGYWAGERGPITNLYQPPRRFDVDDLLTNARKKAGASLVPTNAKGVAQLLKALKRREIVGILPDMEPDKSSGVFAPFFRVPAMTMTLVHSLVRRSGAKVILCCAERVQGGFNIVLLEPDQSISDEDAQVSVCALNAGIEQLVLRSPEQYQWEYKRFKRRPEGYAKLYK